MKRKSFLLIAAVTLLQMAGCGTGQAVSLKEKKDVRSSDVCQSAKYAKSDDQSEKFDGYNKKVDQFAVPEEEALPDKFTLQWCINLALKNNPDIAGADYAVSAAQAGKEIAAGQQWPTIGLGGGYMHALDDQRLVQPRYGNDLGVFGDDVLSGDIFLRMPLYTAGRIGNEVKASELLRQSSLHQSARTRQQLVFNVSQVYYRILAQHHIIESLVFSKKTLNEHKRRVNDMIAVQKSAKVDLLRTEVRLADIEQRVVAEKNVMAILHRMLINFIGLSENPAEIEIHGELQITTIDAGIPDSLVLAIKQRSDYLAMKKQVQAQQKRLDIALAGHSPIVSLDASYGLRNSINPTIHPSGTHSTEDTGFVGLRVEIPIFTGGSINARVRQQRALLGIIRQQFRKLKLQIQLDVETAVLNIQSSSKRVQATQKSIEQARESLRIEREKYQQDKGSITNVLDAQSALLNVQTTYYYALSDYNSAIAQWELAIGEQK